MYFSKMHGLGNDFMVINGIDQKIVISSLLIKQWSNRHTGIGFDQLLLVEKPKDPEYDFNYRIFNSNGNEVEQCGNGARCFGLFLLIKKLTNKKSVTVRTMKKKIIINFMPDNTVQVNMNEPILKKVQTPSLYKKNSNNFSIQLLNNNLVCGIVCMGNPHCIIKVECIKNAPVKKIGKILEKDGIFPNGINVSFMKIINKNHIKLRVYERDVGETQSCGTGACAAVSLGIAQRVLSCNVQVDLIGGTLMIKWNGFKHPLYMTGPATHVYDGFIYI
ncbi:diaminopimelate epimerase [Buchnera aphidicola]|uniref:diaminopimelate epimerase n=1 Tax=Buchnera aphidicola TaxID=9 RepID=UPI001651662E|nr:diaminopimelate epimerase [Buchnera aphidicola]